MDISTYFIENKALFGSYPSDDDIKYFENIGVCYFIDLTELYKLPPYVLSPTSTYIKFSIPDYKIPTDVIEFSSFIIHIDNIIKNLKNNEKIYVHCRGGNGRSGIVVASLLMRYHQPNLTSLDALQLTQKYHSERKNLKLKWKLQGAPQTVHQKNFVIKLFTPFCVHRDMLYGNKFGFVPYSKIKIHIPELNMIFDDAQSAFKYVIKSISEPTDKDIIECMERIQILKVEQCPLFKINLLHTTLRPILYSNVHDKYWGIDKVGNGNNYLGKILFNIRDKLLLQNFKN